MGKKTSTISVGIPCYNQAEYLSQCIESVLQQKTRPLEILVANDGSTDRTLDVIKSYSSYGVRLIDQVNKGLASARNSLIMNSTGSYFFPLDADDMMMENCLERISEVAENTGADIVAPSFKEFGMRSREVVLMPDPKLEDFKTGNRIGYFSAIKRDALLEVGGYSPRMTFGYEDLHLWINLLTRGKSIVTIPEMLVLYRVKENSMINDAQSHHDELMAQIHKDFPQ